MKDTLITIVEHDHYLKQARKLLKEEQIDEIAEILATKPKAGEIMQGTGGFRKMRYAGVHGKGKSGGMRVIYFFVTADKEVHLVEIYGKNEKDNLTKTQRNELAKLASLLKGE